MVACFYGRTEAVKFLLESAIQSMEDEERDFERYIEKYDGNLDRMIEVSGSLLWEIHPWKGGGKTFHIW